MHQMWTICTYSSPNVNLYNMNNLYNFGNFQERLYSAPCKSIKSWHHSRCFDRDSLVTIEKTMQVLNSAPGTIPVNPSENQI